MNEPVGSLSDLVRRWQAGWGLSRGFGPAEEAGGGLRVLPGQADRHLEIIVLHPDEDPASLRRLAAEVATAAHRSWLTVPTHRPDTTESILKGAGLELFGQPEWLMTSELSRQPACSASAHHASAATVEGPVIEATVTHSSGEVAARGTMVVTGADAVADRITTLPAYRRRGLASVVMSSLVQQAMMLGATTGILVASPEGRYLYSALGWNPRATVLVARTRVGTPRC